MYQDQLTISILALFLWYLHNGLHEEVACLIFFFMLSFSKQNLILEFLFEVSNYEQHCNSNKGICTNLSDTQYLPCLSGRYLPVYHGIVLY